MSNSTVEITALNSCTYDTCPISSSPYAYRPNQVVSITFLFSFASSFIGLQVISLYTKQWLKFSIPLCIACLMEVIGYAARIGSWNNPWDLHLYAVTELFLTIAPSLVTSSMYLITQRMLLILGLEHSIMNPRWYPYFIYPDVISFTIQIIGLGIALSDMTATNNIGPGSDKGARVIAAGIGIHELMLIIYLVLFAIALINVGLAYREQGYATFNPERGGHQVLTWRFKLFVTSLSVGVLCLLARDVYRVIGFVEGFDGGSRSEGWFALLDALTVSISVLGLVVFHPAYVFTDYSKENEADKMSIETPVSYGRLARQVIV